MPAKIKKGDKKMIIFFFIIFLTASVITHHASASKGKKAGRTSVELLDLKITAKLKFSKIVQKQSAGSTQYVNEDQTWRVECNDLNAQDPKYAVYGFKADDPKKVYDHIETLFSQQKQIYKVKEKSTVNQHLKCIVQ